MSQATLTDRYVFAAMRTVPERSRDDLAAELRASIADQIESRMAGGDTPADAEKFVLTELGDPDVLAAGYTDRPLRLIGPRYYLIWWRLLKLLLWIVVPISVAGFVLAKILEGAPASSIIGASWGIAITVAAHLFAWLTIVIAIIDRAEAGKKDPVIPWSIDSLPEPHQSGAGRADMIAVLVWLAIAVIGLIWDRFVGFIPGDSFSFINPALWPVWIAGLLLLIGVGVVLTIAVYLKGRWTATLAAINTVVSVAIAVPMLILLSRGELYNPELVQRAHVAGVDDDALTVLAVLVGIVIVGSAVWGVLDAWLKTWRSRGSA